MFQKTIRSSVSASGIGVHSGKKVRINLHPAPINTGVVFKRVDHSPAIEIPAVVGSVVDTRLSTCIGKDGVMVGMVEHLLSAVAGLGIDNLIVEVEAEEMPIMDGSSSPYVFLLQSSGVVNQKGGKKPFIVIDKTVKVGTENAHCSISPHKGFRVSFSIDYDHPNFNEQNQKAIFDFSTVTYLTALCRARTFGFIKDKATYLKQNLALGSSMENAVWLGEDTILNEHGLRYHDEFVRHKILDAIGDLYLLNHAVIGHFTGHKSGHTLNNQLLNAIISDDSNYHIAYDIDLPLYDEPTAEAV
ncbi:MAG: UDP-3-O-[3-hydroxymyristoyl] N-acetylglucosamine deacetylase [Legionellales bacterium]|nr:UDP-3-O-[3-hydroxymyristoyl] N-acetylglucosamine deacetylase [Legionellales bacterium]OUX65720.1 MAG: UDP-3-O-[3-hydroxymyristoyl] N-acetylglucosamine deacetylase [Gammaproteobacteria bacterium TMED281]